MDTGRQCVLHDAGASPVHHRYEHGYSQAVFHRTDQFVRGRGPAAYETAVLQISDQPRVASKKCHE